MALLEFNPISASVYAAGLTSGQNHPASNLHIFRLFVGYVQFRLTRSLRSPWGLLRCAVVRYGLTAGAVVLACCQSYAQTISSISPNPVGIGQSVTISGSNFGSSGSVTFNGVAATTTSWASTAVVATVPAGTASGNVVVTSGGHSSNGFPFTLNNGPVSYIYDDLGRLIAAIDVKGNAAEYTYDAVGNILSISRFTSTHVSIINFSPENGPTATTVTINGTGFSTTPTQNTVKFNGVAATVSSATNTQLQVTVPATATTGLISVLSPNGSATSTKNFTVTSSNGVPTITSFSPSSGVSSTALSLAGTNFDTTLANDKLQLNVTPAVVSTVTSTTIATTVPSATASGRFTLVVPAGNAVSSQDFYIPFGAHATGDIGFTTRIAEGSSQPVTLGANQIGLVLFDAVAGQRVSVGISGSTYAACNLYLIGPNNTTVASTTCTSGNPYLGSTYLPVSGTYTLGVDPSASSGSVTLALVSDVFSTIAINGPPVSVTTTAAGQGAWLSFTADPGQRIVMYATNVTNPGANVMLVEPNGQSQTYLWINNSPPSQVFYLDTQALVAGTNQLWVQPNGSDFGSETLQLVSVPPDFTGTLTVPSAGTTGPAVRVPTSGNLAVGQNATLTFYGTAGTGQNLSFNVSNPTFGTQSSNCAATVYDPSSNQVDFGYCGTGASNFIDAFTLTLTGTYTVSINPQGSATGSASISINNDQDVITPTISIGGSAVTAQTTVAGQDVRLSFTPTASQPRIAVLATNVTNPYATLNLWNGTYSQASVSILNNPSGQIFFIDTQTVNSGQQYQLWVKHSGANIGNETLAIKNVPADISHTVTLGTAYPFTTAIGQNANIKFTINTSESVTVNWTGGTYPSSLGCNLTVTGPSPSNTQVGYGSCNTVNGPVSLGILSSGTYNILVDPQAQSAGGMSLTVTTP